MRPHQLAQHVGLTDRPGWLMLALVQLHQVGQHVELQFGPLVRASPQQFVQERLGSDQVGIVPNRDQGESLHQPEVTRRCRLDRHCLLAFLPLRWGLVTPTSVDPARFVVLGVVHDLEHIHDALGIADAADHSMPVVAGIEDHAVANLVGRREGLPQRAEVGPLRLFGQLAPDGQVSFRNRSSSLLRLPELAQSAIRDDPQR